MGILGEGGGVWIREGIEERTTKKQVRVVQQSISLTLSLLMCYNIIHNVHHILVAALLQRV